MAQLLQDELDEPRGRFPPEIYEPDGAGESWQFRIVEARSAVRDLIRKAIGPGVGEISRRNSVHDAVTAALE